MFAAVKTFRVGLANFPLKGQKYLWLSVCVQSRSHILCFCSNNSLLKPFKKTFLKLKGHNVMAKGAVVSAMI